MTIEFASVSIGVLLIVGVALIWRKLSVVDRRLALMQNELKELHILESRLFNLDTNLSTSVPAAPDADPEQRADGAAKEGCRNARRAPCTEPGAIEPEYNLQSRVVDPAWRRTACHLLAALRDERLLFYSRPGLVRH
jgi:hypothetical protein